MTFRLLLLTALVLGALSQSVTNVPSSALSPIELEAPDGSARAHLMAFGATTTNFWVKDKHGKFRDILLGFDDHTLYASQAKGHPYFGPVVGRYANRIRNGTFTIPISKDASGNGKKFQIVENENNGTDTLHGGLVGYDQRPWSVLERKANSVTFFLVDPNGTQGFPGTVNTTVKYTLDEGAAWKITMHSTASELTPIMLSGHHYWNLEAYQETQDLSGHFLEFDSSNIVATTGALIPTGKLTPTRGTPLDFSKAKSLGAAVNATTGAEYCGTNCVGFDNCWIYDRNNGRDPVFSMWSVNSGIKLEVTTDQPALQVYTCNGIFNPNLPIPRKATQGGPGHSYTDHSCLVVEQESFIDAVNNPEFGIDPIYGPKRAYNWESTYKFSVLKH